MPSDCTGTNCCTDSGECPLRYSAGTVEGPLLIPLLYGGGAVLNRIYGTHKNLYISLFLRTTFGPINYLLRPPGNTILALVYFTPPLSSLDLSHTRTKKKTLRKSVRGPKHRPRTLSFRQKPSPKAGKKKHIIPRSRYFNKTLPQKTGHKTVMPGI